MTAHVLSLVDVCAGHNHRAVVQGISLWVESGELVALSGANGVGKSTLLHCIAGRIPVLEGTILLDGKQLPRKLERRARSGVVLVPEERSVFRSLTVEENLRMSGRKPDTLLSIFPELGDHLRRPAGLLSGGQQQMLSLARALGCEPKFLLIDELSLGLAPLAVGRLLDGLKTTVMSRGTGVLLVEQHVRRALSVVDRGYDLGGGRIVMSGTANHLRDNMDEIEKNYLGPIERDGSGF